MDAIDTTVVKDTDIIPVRNLCDHNVTALIPSLGVRREFPAGATLKVKAGELRALSYETGGDFLLINSLRVGNRDLALELGVSEDAWDNEYNWDTARVRKCLLEDELSVLQDALDFAPDGIRDEICTLAVDLEIPDVRKREVIKEATGNDITRQIENRHAAASTVPEEEKPKRRRTTTGTTATCRRTAGTSEK